MSNHNPEYAILIHYSEIALKKNNRSFFERKFVENITKHLKNLQYSKVRRISSRIFIEGIEYDQWDEIKGRIKNVMGMKNAILMIRSNHNLDDMKNTIDILVDKYKYDTFRITCKRHFKGYEKTSHIDGGFAAMSNSSFKIV